MDDDEAMAAPLPLGDALVVGADDFSSDAFRLLELNADVEQAIAAGSRIVIVGEPDARAVLCTPDKSYYLAKEDTSNLRLLTTHTRWERADAEAEPRAAGQPVEIQVRGSASSHYVLQPKAPDVAQLRALLLESPFEEPERSAGGTSPPAAKRARVAPSSSGGAEQQQQQQQQQQRAGLSTDALVAALQTSEREVLALLEELHAFRDAAGSWRVLRPAYEARVFRDMLDAVVEGDWPALAAPGVPVAQFQARGGEALARHPPEAVRQCCVAYGAVARGEGGERCVLDAAKVAVFCAKALFAERAAERRLARQHSQFQTRSLPLAAGGSDAAAGDDPGWDLAEFLDKWRLRVPAGVPVHADLLRGLVLSRRQGVVYFPEDALPTDPRLRFAALFAAQDKWTVRELEPFIRPLLRPGVTQAALLLRYARASRQAHSAERLYSKR